MDKRVVGAIVAVLVVLVLAFAVVGRRGRGVQPRVDVDPVNAAVEDAIRQIPAQAWEAMSEEEREQRREQIREQVKEAMEDE